MIAKKQKYTKEKFFGQLEKVNLCILSI